MSKKSWDALVPTRTVQVEKPSTQEVSTVPVEDPDEMLDAVVRWVSDGTALTPRQSKRLRRGLKAQAEKLDVGMSTLTSVRMSRLTALLRAQRKIQDSLLGEGEVILHGRVSDRIRANEQIETTIEATVKLMESMRKRGIPILADEGTVALVAQVVEASPARREDLRVLLGALHDQLKRTVARETSKTNGKQA